MLDHDDQTNEVCQINRDSYEPAYLQLASILRNQIANGAFHPGDQLPSEAQLCRRYGVSPKTVRRSINLLAGQRVINPAQGRGAFLKALEVSTAIFNLKQLQELFRQDSVSNIKLLDARVISTDDCAARKLGLPTGAPAIYIHRLFTRNGLPLFYHRAHLVYDPTRPVVEAEMDVTSLQGLFTGGKNTLPAAAFYLEHVFYDFDNAPISWGWFVIPKELLHFTAKVGIGQAND